jgi:hypothetical protein
MKGQALWLTICVDIFMPHTYNKKSHGTKQDPQPQMENIFTHGEASQGGHYFLYARYHQQDQQGVGEIQHKNCAHIPATKNPHLLRPVKDALDHKPQAYTASLVNVAR